MEPWEDNKDKDMTEAKIDELQYIYTFDTDTYDERMKALERIIDINRQFLARIMYLENYTSELQNALDTLTVDVERLNPNSWRYMRVGD